MYCSDKSGKMGCKSGSIKYLKEKLNLQVCLEFISEGRHYQPTDKLNTILHLKEDLDNRELLFFTYNLSSIACAST